MKSTGTERAVRNSVTLCLFLSIIPATAPELTSPKNLSILTVLLDFLKPIGFSIPIDLDAVKTAQPGQRSCQ
jgi:hypothetical protein